MSEQMDKLVSELGGILYGLYNLRPELPKGRSIEEAITRIGKAVLSGKYPELDKLLGVVGRGKADASSTVTPIKGTCHLEGHIETRDEEFMRGSDTDLVDIPIIALRKEKEEREQ